MPSFPSSSSSFRFFTNSVNAATIIPKSLMNVFISVPNNPSFSVILLRRPITLLFAVLISLLASSFSIALLVLGRQQPPTCPFGSNGDEPRQRARPITSKDRRRIRSLSTSITAVNGKRREVVVVVDDDDAIALTTALSQQQEKVQRVRSRGALAIRKDGDTRDAGFRYHELDLIVEDASEEEEEEESTTLDTTSDDSHEGASSEEDMQVKARDQPLPSRSKPSRIGSLNCSRRRLAKEQKRCREATELLDEHADGVGLQRRNSFDLVFHPRRTKVRSSSLPTRPTFIIDSPSSHSTPSTHLPQSSISLPSSDTTAAANWMRKLFKNRPPHHLNPTDRPTSGSMTSESDTMLSIP